MATEKKYLSYDMLSLYDSKMKEHVADSDVETLQAAKTYAEELGDNYDASGSAATAESNANKYTDEQLATEKARAEAVEANLQEQINSVSGSANLEEIVNSINGFNEYMTEHGEVAEGFRIAIDANTQAIEALEETLVDGVTSWNDLTDKPFYDEAGFEIIFKSDFDLLYPTFSYSDDIGMIYEMEFYNTGIRLELGKKYAVKLDGTEYVLDTFVDGDRIYIGDSSIALKTEELPFALYQYSSYDSFYIDLRDQDTHSLEILQEGIIVHKLDAKYLPDYLYGMTPKVYKGVVLERDFTAEELAPNGSEDNVYSYGISNITDYSIGLSDACWYEVLIDGVAYDVPGVHSYYYYVGVSSLSTSQEYPFSIWSTSYGYSFEFTTPGPHSVKITEIELPQVKPVETKFIPKESRANWNESDGTSINYIENRPFYEEFILGDVVYHDTMYASPENRNDDWDTGYYYNTDNIGFDEPLNIEVGRKYSVRVDGVQYILTSQISPSDAHFIDLVGCYDDGRIEPNYEKGNVPVAVEYRPESPYAYFYFKEPGNHEVEIRVVEDSIVHKIEDKYLTQSNWNEEDINSAAYVHNKTHYVEHYYETIFEEATIVSNGQAHSNSQTPAYKYYYVNNTCFMNGDTPMFRVEAGKTYKVTFDGKEYVLVAKPRGSSGAFIGNSWSVNVEGEATDTDVLFTIEDDGTPSWNLFSMGEHSVKIEIQRSTIHTLDPKYLPMDDIATAVLSALPTWTGGSY